MRGVALVSLLASGCFIKPEAPGSSAGDDGGTPTNDAYTGPNFMFVTASTFVANTLTSTTVVDGHCQEAATKARLPGTYVAWWSSANNAIDARDRLSAARGWIRPDGLPFVDTVDDLVNGIIYTPPRIDESKQDLWTKASDALVYTGTSASGQASGFDCGAMSEVTVGVVDATKGNWTNQGSRTMCDQLVHLYCFGIESSVGVSPTPPTAANKLAFMTSAAVSADASFATACNSAGAALRPTAAFVAFVADSTSARSKLPANPNGWYRPDGVKLVDDENFESWQVPLNVTENLTYESGLVYAGSVSFDTAAQNIASCTGWTTTSGQYIAGQVQRSEDRGWSAAQNIPCATNSHVYCFQSD